MKKLIDVGPRTVVIELGKTPLIEVVDGIVKMNGARIRCHPELDMDLIRLSIPNSQPVEITNNIIEPFQWPWWVRLLRWLRLGSWLKGCKPKGAAHVFHVIYQKEAPVWRRWEASPPSEGKTEVALFDPTSAEGLKLVKKVWGEWDLPDWRLDCCLWSDNEELVERLKNEYSTSH